MTTMLERGLISIDRWSEGSQAYFLTHLHADHTNGLSERWSHGPLFCSPTTARLLPIRFPGFRTSLLRPLDIGIAASLSLRSTNSGANINLRVTPIDAHHCPGAVMYLFEGEFGCVLYTGDFRWEAESERSELAKKTLLGALKGNNVDTLYMDNTYCHPSFSFPSREEAAQQIVDIIKLHPNHDIVIGIDTLGKEDLLVHISEALNTKIWVWPERLQTMHLLGYDDIFTTKTCLTRVRAVPRYSLTYDTLEALNTVHPTIGIMPSGLPWGVKPFEEKNSSPHLSGLSSNSTARTDRAQIQSRKKLQHFAYSVPYSEHSCFGELEDFIMIVKPSIVIGIVSSSFCYINPRHYFSHLCRASQAPSSKVSDNKDSEPETVEVMQSQFVLAYKKSGKIRSRKEVNFKVGTPSGCRSRVSALRREKSGAKIADSSSIFCSLSSD